MPVARKRPPFLKRLRRSLDVLLDLQSQGVVGGSGSFAAARHSRLTLDWLTKQLSATEELRRDLRALRDRSRSLARDTAYGARFRQLLNLHVVGTGPRGIACQVRSTSTRGNLNASVNDEVERAFWDWGKPGECTVDGKLSWGDVQRLAIGGVAIDGEFLAVEQVAGPYGYQLTVLDPDQLDEQHEAPVSLSGGPIVQGVEHDMNGRPAFYHIWSSHPTDWNQRRVRLRVSAEQVIHLFVVVRAGQVRGIPWTAPIILDAFHLDRYAEYEVVAARQGQGNSVFYEQDPEATDLSEQYPQGAAIPQELQPAQGYILPPGYTANVPNATHPHGSFPDFQKAILHGIAAGLGVAYTSLASDLREVNYSSIQAGLMDERDYWRMLQWWLIERLHERVFARFLTAGVVRGTVHAQPSMVAGIIEHTTWKPRGWPWVDPQKEAQSIQLKRAMGLTSYTKEAAALGADLPENLEEIKQENALAAELGVTLAAGAPAPTPPGGAKDEDDDENEDPKEKDRMRLLRRGA